MPVIGPFLADSAKGSKTPGVGIWVRRLLTVAPSTTKSPEQEGVSMFVSVLENMGKITGATAQMQTELFKKWFSLWPGVPGYPMGWTEQVQKVQKKWVEAVSEMLRRQRETVEAQFKAGQANIEKAFQVGEAKTPE